MEVDSTTCQVDFYFSILSGQVYSSTFKKLQETTSFSLEIGSKTTEQESCQLGALCIYTNSVDPNDRRSFTILYDSENICINDITKLNFNGCTVSSCKLVDVDPNETNIPCTITGKIFDIEAKWLTAK